MNYFYTMELHYCSGLLFVLRSLNSYSQIDIIERVEDELDGRPLPSASVYLIILLSEQIRIYKELFILKIIFQLRLINPCWYNMTRTRRLKIIYHRKDVRRAFLQKELSRIYGLIYRLLVSVMLGY